MLLCFFLFDNQNRRDDSPDQNDRASDAETDDQSQIRGSRIRRVDRVDRINRINRIDRIHESVGNGNDVFYRVGGISPVVRTGDNDAIVARQRRSELGETDVHQTVIRAFR